MAGAMTDPTPLGTGPGDPTDPAETVIGEGTVTSLRRPITWDRWRMMPDRTVVGGVMRRRPIVVVPENQVYDAISAADRLVEQLDRMALRRAQSNALAPLLAAYRNARDKGRA